jgi:Flp pilus assembly protein protease CpaA
MNLADIIITCIGLTALFIATVTDLKKKEIPDWLNFSVIAAALGVRLGYYVYSSDYMYLLYGLLGFAIMFGLGMLLYYGRMWGGGDTKLLMGLGILFATKPFFVPLLNAHAINYPFLALLIFNIIIVGSFYSLGYATYLFSMNLRKAIAEIKKQARRVRSARILYMVASFVFLAIFFFIEAGIFKMLCIALAVFFTVYIHLLIFIRAVEKSCMYKVIPISKLTEGDWVAEDIKFRGKLLYSHLGLGVEKKHIKLIRDAGIRHVLIKEGIAFVPSFFLGLLVTLLFGSFIL